MKRSRFPEEQITYALRQAKSGTAVADVCRQLGVSEATFYICRKKFAHFGVSELRRMRQIEEENSRLKKPVADLTLDKHILQKTLRKSRKPTRRRARVTWIQEIFHMDVRRACRLAGFSRSGWYRKRTGNDQTTLRMRIREIAHARPRFGYLLIAVMLRREGWTVNHKRVYGCIVWKGCRSGCGCGGSTSRSAAAVLLKAPPPWLIIG